MRSMTHEDAQCSVSNAGSGRAKGLLQMGAPHLVLFTGCFCALELRFLLHVEMLQTELRHEVQAKNRRVLLLAVSAPCMSRYMGCRRL